jgi:hypothetical protein
MSGADEACRLIDKGRQLRSSGDRTGSLTTFREAIEADLTNATAIIECGYDHLHLVQIAEARTAVARIVELVKIRIPRRFGFDPIRDVQVLCPINRGALERAPSTSNSKQR